MRPRTLFALSPISLALFLGCGADPSKPQARHDFKQAVIEGNLAAVKAWLDAGLTPAESPTTDTCFTPIGLAAKFGHVDILKMLLAKGADPNVDTGGGISPIQCASGNRASEVTTLLLAAGARPAAPKATTPPASREVITPTASLSTPSGMIRQEADAIAASCVRLIAADVKPRDILILLASRSPQAGLWSLIRTALAQANVPFDPPKEEGFADSPAGRLVLGLTRIITSRDDGGVPEDLIAHRTVLGLKRGVGVGTCNAIRTAVIATPQTSFRALFYDPLPDGVFAGRALSALNHARETCATIAAWQETDTLGHRRDQLRALVESTIDAAAAQDWVTFSAPLPHGMLLSELRDYLWVDNAQQQNEILRAVATRLGVDPEEVPPELDHVRVMTMHGAKGLSARVVFIPGLEHGLLPNQHQTPYPAQLLEAARLLYVSITRARAVCVLSFAQRRTVQGEFQVRTASQFATHTGGAFEGRNEGLTDDETTAVVAVIDGL